MHFPGLDQPFFAVVAVFSTLLTMVVGDSVVDALPAATGLQLALEDDRSNPSYLFSLWEDEKMKRTISTRIAGGTKRSQTFLRHQRRANNNYSLAR